MRNQSQPYRNRPHPHTLQEIDPAAYISDPQGLIIATAIKNWLLSLPDPLRKTALKRVVNPTVFQLDATDAHKNVEIIRASINFPELLEITTAAVEAARQQLEESEGDSVFHKKILKYYNNLDVDTILKKAGDGFMELLCDCHLFGR